MHRRCRRRAAARRLTGVLNNMISVDVCQNGNSVSREVEVGRISDLLRQRHKLLWVDVDAPDDETWRVLQEEFDFHSLAIEDARKQNQRPKVDEYPNCLFISLREWTGPQHATDDLTDVTREIDVFVGKNYLVTVHHSSSTAIEEIRKRWEAHPERIEATPGALLHILLDTIVDGYFPAMDAIDGEIDEVESAIYGNGREVVDLAPVLGLKKRLLLLRQTVAPLRDVLNHLLRVDNPFLTAHNRAYYMDVFDHVLRLTDQIDIHRDILGGVMDAIMAQTNNRLNNVMKTLTVISTILMTASLIAGIYGMNFKNMPELNDPNGYYKALLMMVLSAVALIFFFRRVRWL